LGVGLTTPHRKKMLCYEMSHRVLDFGICSERDYG